jgi:hypothetical protein
MANTHHKRRIVKSKISETRFIKTGTAYYDYHLKNEGWPRPACRSVPWIQLKGHWLKKAGFDIDTPIKVRAMEGCLVLTSESD